MMLFIIFSCLGKVIPYNELLKKNKYELLNYFEKEILDIEESNRQGVLGIAIENLGDKEELIYTLWGKGIKDFDSVCFLRSKELNIDSVDFIFNNINKEKKIECFKNLLCNKEMLNEAKLELLIKILERDLISVKESNNQGVLGIAIENLGNKEKLIYTLWGKGIKDFDSACFLRSKELNIDVVDFIFSEIDEKVRVKCFKHLIQNKEITEEYKVYLLLHILKNYTLDIEDCNKQNVLDFVLIYLHNEYRLAKKLWEKEIREFNPSKSFYNIDSLSVDLANLIFEDIDEDKLISCLGNIIKNKKIGNQEKENIVNEILERKDLNIGKCNEKGILNIAIGSSSGRTEVLKSLWNKGITRFDFIKILNGWSEINYSAIEFLFKKLKEKEILDIFSKVLLSEEIEKGKKLKLIVDGMFLNFLFLKGKNVLITLFQDLEADRIIDLLKTGMLEKLDSDIIHFLFNNFRKEEAAQAFQKAIIDDHIENIEERAKRISLINDILGIKIKKELLDAFNEKEILGAAIEYLGDEEDIIRKLWDIGIRKFSSEVFSRLKKIHTPLMKFLFKEFSKEKASECLRQLIGNERMDKRDKYELISTIEKSYLSGSMKLIKNHKKRKFRESAPLVHVYDSDPEEVEVEVRFADYTIFNRNSIVAETGVSDITIEFNPPIDDNITYSTLDEYYGGIDSSEVSQAEKGSNKPSIVYCGDGSVVI